ncbi:MAG: PQQ-binding-like beta-propeller repeat protein [Planctomycetaceae bacterium]
MNRSPAGLRHAALACLVAAAALPPACADDWSHWRGPQGNGVAPEARPPLEFGPGRGERWKVEIPGRGTSSPVVRADRVFVTTAVPAADDGTLDFRVICLDRATGRGRWSRTVVTARPHEGTHQTNGFASASPCVDDERVYAHFGSRGLFCLSLDGEPLWDRDFGDMRIRNGFGEGSSPTLHGDVILVPWDHEGPSALHCLDARSGTTRWETPRDEPSGWCTPLVAADRAGTLQVIMNGQNAARGYDLATGRELWRCAGQTARPCASGVAADGVAWVGSGFRGAFLAAFDLSGRGDLEGGDAVLWTHRKDTPDVASPLLSDGRIYFYKEKSGLLSCLEAATGKPLWETARIEGLNATYASPIAAGGRVYLSDRRGTIVVIDDAPQLRILATNAIGEGIDATPAAAGDALFVRGERHLWCFADERVSAAP